MQWRFVNLTEFGFFLITARITPFIIGVTTDADEVTTGVTMTDNTSNGNEQFKVPGGIVGFHLTYTQTC